VPLRDVQEAASRADPRTRMRYDRARASLDRHGTYVVAAFIAGQPDRASAARRRFRLADARPGGSPGQAQPISPTVTSELSTSFDMRRPAGRPWLSWSHRKSVLCIQAAICSGPLPYPQLDSALNMHHSAPMADLEAALETSREMIGAALADARAELSALNARRAELQALISQGEAALGGGPLSPVAKGTMTLHDALVLILRERNNEPMTARELANAVNDRGLYRKRDGSPVEVNQVHARASNYEVLFEKDGALIQLREESPMLDALPPGIASFRDDDGGFFAWLECNPDGYVINSERNPKPTYLVLHRPSCPHFKGGTDLHWTKDYVKFCSPDRTALEEWATGTVGGEVTLCRNCFG
jgi:hypothetical protein